MKISSSLSLTDGKLFYAIRMETKFQINLDINQEFLKILKIFRENKQC